MGDLDRSLFKVQLSAYHFYASEIFAVAAAKIENEAGEHGPTGRGLYEYRANVMASVMEAVACLEAYANEVVAESGDARPALLLRGMPATKISRLAAVRQDLRRTHPVVEKCDRIVQAIDGHALDHDDQRYVNAVLLVNLRNHLVHFDGEWMEVPSYEGLSVPQRGRHRIERVLMGKFPRDRFTHHTDPFFPDQCLGAPCARWACVSAYQYSTWFANRIGAMECFFLTQLPESVR